MAEPQIEQYSHLRGICICPETNELWEYLKDIDVLASDADACRRRLESDGEPRKGEIRLTPRGERWKNKLMDYSRALEGCVGDGSVLAMDGRGEFLPTGEDVEEGTIVTGLYCSGCRTKIPIPTYKDWTFERE